MRRETIKSVKESFVVEYDEQRRQTGTFANENGFDTNRALVEPSDG